MTKPTLLLVISSLLATTTALATPASLPPPLPSQLTGTIQVLAVTSLYKATPKDSIGCLNNAGLLTLNDCAIFSRQSDGPGVLSTNLGNCSFQDQSMPENKESHYGRGTYAWRCTREELKEAVGEVYYTAVSSFRYLLSSMWTGERRGRRMARKRGRKEANIWNLKIEYERQHHVFVHWKRESRLLV